MLKRLVVVAVTLLLMATEVKACNLLGIFGCGGNRGGCRFVQPCRQYTPTQGVPCGTVIYSSGTAVYPTQVIPAGYSVPCQNGRCPTPTAIPTSVPGTVFPPVPVPDNPPKIAPTGIPDTPVKPAPKIEPK